MKALVTGGTGFIGREVVRQLLDAGDSVRIFSRSRNASVPFSGNVEIAQGDLGDVKSLMDALENIDVFFHIGEIKNTSKAASEKNVNLVKEVLGQIKTKQVRRIVFVSSITVSGIPSSIPAVEETSQRIILNDHYTDCKRRCENLLIESTEDVEWAIIRPAPVYGPGSRNLGRFISLLDRFGPLGLPFPGNAENLAPLIFVRDLAHAIALAGREPAAAGQIFNITDGVRHTWREFLQTITENLGKNLRIIPVPPPLLQFAVLPLDLVSVFFGIRLDPVSYVSYFSENLYFSTAKAEGLLNWHPGCSLSEGIKEMTEFYIQKK